MFRPFTAGLDNSIWSIPAATRYIDAYITTHGLAEGVQGPQGPINGLAGQGVQGMQGLQGVTEHGFQGPQGVQGSAGVDGVQGAQGLFGVNGAHGFQGLIGTTGVQGVQGLIGANGVQGFQGLTGADGVQGFQGLTGANGVQGYQGLTGTDGIQGYQGLTGVDGVQGFQGLTGVDGVQGFQGLTGVNGVQGFQGLVGVDGAQGYQGLVGVNGVQGYQGLVGVDGMQGVQGFTGTDGFQGVQGSTGTSGAQGFQGYQGTVGSHGTQGHQGFQGGDSPPAQPPQWLAGTFVDFVSPWSYFQSSSELAPGWEGAAFDISTYPISSSPFTSNVEKFPKPISSMFPSTLLPSSSSYLYAWCNFTDTITQEQRFLLILTLYFAVGVRMYLDGSPVPIYSENDSSPTDARTSASGAQRIILDAQRNVGFSRRLAVQINNTLGGGADADIWFSLQLDWLRTPKLSELSDVSLTALQTGEILQYNGTNWVNQSVGVQGFQGDRGLTGLEGTQGVQGIVGANGVQGFQGYQGYQGDQGAQGNVGIQGPQGPDVGNWTLTDNSGRLEVAYKPNASDEQKRFTLESTTTGIWGSVGTSTSGFQMPSGTSAQTPGATLGLRGTIRYNNETHRLECCDGVSWMTISAGSGHGNILFLDDVTTTPTVASGIGWYPTAPGYQGQVYVRGVSGGTVFWVDVDEGSGNITRNGGFTSAKGAFQLPRGNTIQRPFNGEDGTIGPGCMRWNEQTNNMEFMQNDGAWRAITSTSA